MEASGRKEHSFTDFDARSMKKVGVGYNGQIAVDDKHHLIVAAEVVNEPTDYHQLLPVAQAAKETLEVEQIKAVADGGYHDRDILEACEKAGVEACVPQPRKGAANKQGAFHKTEFVYQAESDSYRCPAGQSLKANGKAVQRGEPVTVYLNREACRGCEMKAQCTKADYRQLLRGQRDECVERTAKRVEQNPLMMERRKELAEHPFGTIKFWMNQWAFLLRGLEKVGAEFRLSALAYNIKRVLGLVSLKELFAKLPEWAAKGAEQAGKAASKGVEAALSAAKRRFEAQIRSSADPSRFWEASSRIFSRPRFVCS
jgi:hypothetical protein